MAKKDRGGASFILAVLSPILGALADYKNMKKRFFLFFIFLGMIFTLLLLFVEAGQWLLCLVLFVVARVGWAGANIFYNVFGKFAAISGPLLMGLVGRLTGETRWGILSILLLFVIGSVLLGGVKDSAE